MPKKITQEEAEAKSLIVGIKMIGIYLSCHKTTEFECPFCAKQFEAQPNNIWLRNTKSCGCQKNQMCADCHTIPKVGNSLLEKFPNIAKEWHPTKNGNKTPLDINYGSHIKVWWLGKCGHEWFCRLKHRTCRHNRCPICSGRKILVGFNDLLTLEPELCKEWDYDAEHNKKLPRGNGPQFYTKNSNAKITWKCLICGHKWQATIVNRTNRKSSCPRCNESKGEKEVGRILDSLNIKYEREKSYSDLCGIGNGLLRFDFYLPEYNTLLEYQGAQHYGEHVGYFEKSSIRTQQNDKIKKQYCKKNNISLITIHHKDFDKIEEILCEKLKISS